MLECDGRRGCVGEISLCSLVPRVHCHFVQLGSSRVFLVCNTGFAAKMYFYCKCLQYWFLSTQVLAAECELGSHMFFSRVLAPGRNGPQVLTLQLLSSISVSVLEYLHLGVVVHMWPGAPDVAHRVSEELLCGNHPSYVAGPLYCCVETIPPMWRANNLFHIVQATRFFHLDLCARCHNLFLYPVFLLVGKQSKLWHA